MSYLEHPQKDFVNLISEVYFPNLTFDKVIVDFGSVQNYLEKQQILKLSNSSSLPVHYSWYFIECEGTDISQIFDILPIYGVIKPGKTQEAYITYFALADKVSKATLVCDVQGGPKYEIRVIGTATPLKLEPSRVAASVI